MKRILAPAESAAPAAASADDERRRLHPAAASADERLHRRRRTSETGSRRPSVVVMMCKGRDSISRMVQNSLDMRRVFSDFVKSSTSKIVKSAVTNMRAACHRFESFQKPLGRTCIHMHACIRTALHVASRAQPDVANRAKAWLRWLDTEKCLTLSMMADVADEAMSLTRLLDTEGVDPAILNKEVSNFNVTVSALFGDSKQCLSVFGYTSVMMNLKGAGCVADRRRDLQHRLRGRSSSRYR
jgi:hypothetical protein